jgi:hypothetical protein
MMNKINKQLDTSVRLVGSGKKELSLMVEECLWLCHAEQITIVCQLEGNKTMSEVTEIRSDNEIARACQEVINTLSQRITKPFLKGNSWVVVER